jgi:predicted Holliday junction resolvase-like endonuclease
VIVVLAVGLVGITIIASLTNSKSYEQIREENIEAEGKELQQQWEGERAQRQRELKVQLKALEEDMKKHPERYR